MASLASSSEEVVVVQTGDIYFFPCKIPGSAKPNLYGATLVPCADRPYFAVAIDMQRYLQSTPGGMSELRVRTTLESVWRWLLSLGKVVGEMPDIVQVDPTFTTPVGAS